MAMKRTTDRARRQPSDRKGRHQRRRADEGAARLRDRASGGLGWDTVLLSRPPGREQHREWTLQKAKPENAEARSLTSINGARVPVDPNNIHLIPLLTHGGRRSRSSTAAPRTCGCSTRATARRDASARLIAPWSSRAACPGRATAAPSTRPSPRPTPMSCYSGTCRVGRFERSDRQHAVVKRRQAEAWPHDQTWTLDIGRLTDQRRSEASRMSHL